MQQIITRNMPTDELTKVISDINSVLYTWIEDETGLGKFNRRNSLSEAGMEIFSKLLNLIKENPHLQNRYIILIWEIIKYLRDLSCISHDQLIQLKLATENRLVGLRKFVRNIEETPDDPQFIDACCASGKIKDSDPRLHR